MQNDQSDLALIFKKRARRRLVGAIALVLLMVVLLPMLLKDRSKMEPQQEIAIVMPNATSEKAIDGTVVDVDGVTTYEEVIELPQAEVPAKPVLEKQAEPEKVADTPKVKEVPKAVVKPKVEAKPEAKPVEKEKQTVKSASQPLDSQFYVQIGVFSDPANVKKLKVKLDELGYASVTEKISTDTGEKTRLRTVGFTGKNEAVIALQNIKDAGLTGMVVSQK